MNLNDKINRDDKRLKFVLEKFENNQGKEENAGNQHFLLFPTVFSKAVFLRVVQKQKCAVKG